VAHIGLSSGRIRRGRERGHFAISGDLQHLRGEIDNIKVSAENTLSIKNAGKPLGGRSTAPGLVWELMALPGL